MPFTKGHTINIGRKVTPRFGVDNPFFGRKHSEFLKEKWSLMKKGKHFSKNTEFKDGDNLREEHPNWVGSDISYIGLHAWLRREFGEATYCENEECLKESERFDWALLKGKVYERKRENFIRLCRKCHLNYDKVAEKGWVTKKNG